MNNKLTAFTLVELLVVIAIIGILSGLIIVGMSSSTNSARVAKAQVFSAALRDSLLASLVSEWKFDGTGVSDGSNATTAYTQDSWTNNNCTITGTPLVYSGTNCVYSSCLKFNGTTDYLDCGNGNNLNITGAIVVEAWVKTTSTATQIFVEKNPGGTNGYSLLSISGQLAGRLYPNSISSTKYINDNNWHHVVMSDDVTNWILYVDGDVVTKVTGVAIVSNTAQDLLIGARGGPNLFFSGYLDNVRIYNSSISSLNVRENYYTGLSNLLKNGGISLDQYREKIKELATK